MQRNRATPEHRGQFSNSSRKGRGSSYQPRPCNVRPAAAAVDGRACRRGPRHSNPRCRHSGDNSCGVSNDKRSTSTVCGLWDACRSTVQRPVDWGCRGVGMAGATGGARPRNVETTRARVSFRPRNIFPHRLTTVGRRAFAVHGPMVWNSLPDDLRAQQDYESFRQGLKTWLFSRY